jgi:hypothetical protein
MRNRQQRQAASLMSVVERRNVGLSIRLYPAAFQIKDLVVGAWSSDGSQTHDEQDVHFGCVQMLYLSTFTAASNLTPRRLTVLVACNDEGLCDGRIREWV